MTTTQKFDNRDYFYDDLTITERDDYNYVIKLIDSGSRIVDLGCGDGSLMLKIIREKNVTAEGIELSPSGVDICIKKGLKVKQGRIDADLPYKDNEFDYAVCNVTIQMVTYPEILLSEMRRIARYQIISFPNFGFYKNRLDFILHGRMPQPMLFGFKWYNTGHIHQLTIKDFYELVEDVGGLTPVKMEKQQLMNPLKNFLAGLFPNLFQVVTVHLLKKN